MTEIKWESSSSGGSGVLLKIGTYSYLSNLHFQVEVCEKAFDRALALNDAVLATKIAAVGFSASEVIDEIGDCVDNNKFKFILESRVVGIERRSFLFHF